MGSVDFREIAFESAVWPPTLASVLGQIREDLPEQARILRWAVTAVTGHQLRVEAIIYLDSG